MKLVVERSKLGGTALIPASKSHTVRAVFFGALASGTSRIIAPLDSADTRSAIQAAKALGASIQTARDEWTVTGFGGRPAAAEKPVDVGNSGTTLFIALSAAALGRGTTTFIGDEQTSKRSASNLLASLRDLGTRAVSHGPQGCVPIDVTGPMRGGSTSIECPTSQYLTSLLISCPLAEEDTVITVPLLYERPYIEMTLEWLRSVGGGCEHDDAFSEFHVAGGQGYSSFERRVPADFSSATFFLAAAAVTGSRISLPGLDMNDTQGDRAVVSMLQEMGCMVVASEDGLVIEGGSLRGYEFDLNNTPDALPAIAAVACFAEGETRLVNVPQARMKETDRIEAMAAELRKLGAETKELPDGLVVRPGNIRGAEVDGRGDHRVVMALAVAGLGAEGRTTVTTAESVSVTFPTFVEQMQNAGAKMNVAP